MPHFSKRVQVLLTSEQHIALEAIAKQHHQPLGATIREAIERQLLEEVRDTQRLKASKELCSMNLPVLEDWPEWKRQYEAEKGVCGMIRETRSGT